MKVPRVATGLTVKKSEWGWTAYHPTGRAVAHSTSKALLEGYVRSCTS